MLNINNSNDVDEMMKYHRTKDMINLIMYFPELSPIRNLTIVKSLSDYKNNYNFCKNLPCERNDTLITKPCMKSIETSGGKYIDVDNMFEKIKQLDQDGVLVLFDLCHEPSERYERYAGISVGVSLGEGVFIDAVGKGFDGREVSKGLDSHERYFIPWFDMRKCCVSNFKKYRTYIISNDDYKCSRDNRIEFLKSIGLPIEKISKTIPENYEEIPNFIWLDIIKNIIKKLEKMEYELSSVGLTEFAISGHTEGKQFLPWQMFDKTRYRLLKRK